MGISAERNALLLREGIASPTPIQAEGIPAVLAGRDVVCQAQTGTGKTLAFLLPMFEKLDPSEPALQGLILTPTRELALQITNEIKRFQLPGEKKFTVLSVYGGQDVEAQTKKFASGVQLAVATPGRLLDHMRRGNIHYGTLKMFVLDEADQMLHIGFWEEVAQIMQALPEKRQTLLFSATMPDPVFMAAKEWMHAPLRITVRTPQVILSEIKQRVYETTDRRKQSMLIELLHEQRPYLGIIFCRTRRRAKTLAEALAAEGFAVDELHGDLSQNKREQVMKRFREAKLQLLVATDVAARGLDVEGVTHVYNYDFPQDADSYIHRIGRTGRAGDTGLAVTFVTARDQQKLEFLEKRIGMKIPYRTLNGGVELARQMLEEDRQARKAARGGGSGNGTAAATAGKGRGKAGRGAGRGGRKVSGGRASGREAKVSGAAKKPRRRSAEGEASSGVAGDYSSGGVGGSGHGYAGGGRSRGDSARGAAATEPAERKHGAARGSGVKPGSLADHLSSGSGSRRSSGSGARAERGNGGRRAEHSGANFQWGKTTQKRQGQKPTGRAPRGRR
jgi:ATP-dependent RNA helicase DeaD